MWYENEDTWYEVIDLMTRFMARDNFTEKDDKRLDYLLNHDSNKMRRLVTTDWAALRQIADNGLDFIFGMTEDDHLIQHEAANDENINEG